MNPNTRPEAIAIAADIFAAGDSANCKDPQESRPTRKSRKKARYVDVIARKLAWLCDGIPGIRGRVLRGIAIS